MGGIFAAPVFADAEKTQRAANLFRLTWVVFCTLTLSLAGRAAVQPDVLSSAILSFVTIGLLSLLVLQLSRRGRVTAACWLLLGGYIANLMRSALAGGGIHLPGIAMLYIYALIASVLLGFRAGVFTAVLCALLTLGLAIAEYLGLLAPPRASYSAVYYWLVYSFYLALTLFLVRMIADSIKTAFEHSNRELLQRRRTEHFLNIALDAGAIGVWQWEPDTGNAFWDTRVHAIFGLPPGAKVDYDGWAAMVLPEDLPGQEAALQEAISTGRRMQREYRIRTPAGIRHVYVAAQVCATAEGEPLRLIGINMDITARKEAEEETRRIKNQLETLVEQARIGILVHRQFRPIAVNAALLAMFAVSREEVLAVADIRDFMGPEAGLSGASYAQRLKDLEVPMVMDTRCRRNDGEWIDCEIRAFPIQWEGEASICAMVTDVTQRKRLEAQLLQTQRLEAIGRITGGVAHDFNNLLTVILGNAEVMEKSLRDDPLLSELASMTRQAAEQGAELTSRLLAFSRQQPLSIRSADIDALIGGMSGLMRRVLHDGIALEFRTGPGLWRAAVDVVQLESALLNLAINARDAMSKGGTLTVEAANVRLTDADLAGPLAQPGAVMGDYVMLAVCDTGTGMDAATRARLFEPFFTTKSAGTGSGLGLSIVYGFIAQLGGHIRVVSEPGAGTAIRLYLPRAQGEALAEEAESAPALPAGGSESILLVEDHDLVRKQVAAQLESLGYRVTSACDGPAALEILKTRSDFDLLFTDVVMPRGLNGMELAREAVIIRPGLPVLFTSSFTDNALAQEGRLDPSVNLLSKPYRREVLAAKLRHALDRSRRKVDAPG